MGLFRLIVRSFAYLLSWLPTNVLSDIVYYSALYRSRSLSPQQGVKFLMNVDNRLYPLQRTAAVRYGVGIHTKHRHMRYHNFFVNRVHSGERVLDVECGIGAVAYDVAEKAGAEVVGIDLNPQSITQARAKFSHERVSYRLGDVLTDLPNERFDTIIMSNVLEHIEDRVGFLRQLCQVVSPQRLLIRVPLFERDWRVPLKQELGLDYRLDSPHITEHTLESFATEMEAARLTITHLESRWGEIWAEVIPSQHI